MSKTNAHIITKSEIVDWINSASYSQYHSIPISKLRAESYQHNPHAADDDPLIFLLFEKSQLITFRTVFPDILYLKDGGRIKFAWLSGSWVHPDHRRKGLSTLLLKKVIKFWKGNLMYTNYAPASKKLYDKTGEFKTVTQFSGIRYFTKEGLKDKIHSRWPMLEGLPIAMGLMGSILKAFHPSKKGKKVKLSSQMYISTSGLNELEGLIQNKAKSSLRRNKSDFEWILNYPWANQSDDAKMEAARYPFSCWSPDFFSKPLLIQTEKSSSSPPLIWPVIKNGDLKLTYCSYRDEQLPLIVEALLMLIKNQELRTLTIWDKKINTQLQHNKHPFVFYKKQNQMVFAHKSLMDSINEELKIDFGDGDVVFV